MAIKNREKSEKQFIQKHRSTSVVHLKAVFPFPEVNSCLIIARYSR